MLAPLLLLVFALMLLAQSLQARLRAFFQRSPPALFVAPLSLTLLFCFTAMYYRCLTSPLALLILVYTFVPTTLPYRGHTLPLSNKRKADLLDLCAILLLWLPLELSVGATLVPRPVQAVIHATAYAVAITLGLVLFLLFRSWDGMKYRLPTRAVDARNVLLGYIVSFLVLIPLGLYTSFLAPPHWPRISWTREGLSFALIFFGTALPEEILFRALIQNWFTQQLKHSWSAVVVSALIFGAAHLNNGPGALPNWRYMAIATLAGLIFGTVFLRSTSILASVAVHAGVNLTKHLFF